MISNVVLHSLPGGYRFDLQRRTRVVAPMLRAIDGQEASPRADARCELRSRRRRGEWSEPRVARASPARLRQHARARPARTRRATTTAKASLMPATGGENGREPRSRAGPKPTLRILETRVLRGPNVWARRPVIRMLVDLGVLEEFPSNTVPGFNEALVELLPGLEEHACSLGRRGGLLTRLADGTWLGHVAEHVALELQTVAGTDVRIGKTRAAGPVRPLQRHLRVPGGVRSASRPAGSPSPSSTTSSRRTTPTPRSTSRRRWRRSSASRSARRSGPRRRRSSMRRSHATSRCIRLDRHSLVQLGQGVHQQRIRATMTSQDLVDRASTSPPTRPSPTSCSARRACRCRARRRCATPTAARRRRASDRLSRSSSSRSTATTGAASASTCASDEDVRRAFAGALAAEPRRRRRRRDVRHRQRPPRARHRRAGHRGRRAGPGGRHRRRRAHGRAARRHRERRPSARHRAREGAHPHRARTRPPTELVAKQGMARDVGARGGHPRPAGPDRQHVDRRHGHRPDHDIHPDNVEIAETAARIVGLDIAGIDFIVPDIARPRPRAGRRDRRGQRGARVPDAHQPDRGRAAVRRPAGRRPAVPARQRRAHPDHRGDGHERQDDDRPDDRPHPQAHGPARRA